MPFGLDPVYYYLVSEDPELEYGLHPFNLDV